MTRIELTCPTPQEKAALTPALLEGAAAFGAQLDQPARTPANFTLLQSVANARAECQPAATAEQATAQGPRGRAPARQASTTAAISARTTA